MQEKIRIGAGIICRGIGQVIFVDSALAGAIMLLGLALGSWAVAMYALVGTIVTTITARTIACPRSDIEQGLCGYNGTLVGIATQAFCGSGLGSLALAVGASVLVAYVARSMAGQSLVPVLTAPFVLVAWVVYALVQHFPSLGAE